MVQAEFQKSLIGVWRLVLNRDDAISHFDLSRRGLGQSFGALGLIWLMLHLISRFWTWTHQGLSPVTEISDFIDDAVQNLAQYLILPILVAFAASWTAHLAVIPSS